MIKQTPWIERTFDFNFPVGLFPVIVERLIGTLPQFKDLVNNLPENILSHKDGKTWSVKEQVGHLYDLEELWFGRIEDFLSEKPILRAADMSNAKTDAAHHNNNTIDELLEKFISARKKLLNKIANFDEETVSITAIHPRLQKPIRLVDSLFFIAEHDDHHLAKIRTALKKEIGN